ncbi:MAG: hypothetical protein HOP12_11135 [Candidatus Eisenbacteria bacterium]|uniref:Uncharacterized protein n=1 Tax=Eiseniibacteriota bacterium TaxID=2212470 RepID=A0A849SG32_UNCEI|nr:hypothetical protein [Candidatus Eisenbacteria bacterium]
MQLHYLVAPQPLASGDPSASSRHSDEAGSSSEPGQIAGTPAAVSGVFDASRPEGVIPTARSRAFTWRYRLAIASLGIACFSLLGQGERCRVDPRFVSPSRTLDTYWSALRHGDADLAWECLVDGRHDLPMPGSLWFLPETDTLLLTNVRALPVTSARVVVNYDVVYVPRGVGEMRTFHTGDELVRERGAWRISRAIGEASMPDWEPIPGPVDI